MKFGKIVAAYKALGEAKVTKIEESEVLKIVKARKAMRPYADDYEAFLKDVQEKFKPSNFESLQQKTQKWNDLTDEEKVKVNKALREYEKKITDAVKEELEKEVELTLEKLNESTLTKLLQENGWELKKLDDLECMV